MEELQCASEAVLALSATTNAFPKREMGIMLKVTKENPDLGDKVCLCVCVCICVYLFRYFLRGCEGLIAFDIFTYVTALL
jgi:hypothetical protein